MSATRWRAIVERFQVEGQLFDDVGFQDVENFDRPIEQLSELDGGVGDGGRARTGVDGRHDRPTPVDFVMLLSP